MENSLNDLFVLDSDGALILVDPSKVKYQWAVFLFADNRPFSFDGAVPYYVQSREDGIAWYNDWCNKCKKDNLVSPDSFSFVIRKIKIIAA